MRCVVKEATRGVQYEAFYKVAHALSVYLRSQHNLISNMGSQCPKDTTRWIAFGSMLSWLLAHRRRFLAHFDETVVENNDWYINKAAINTLILDQGSWARDLLNELRDGEQDCALVEVGNFALSLISAGMQIQAERDSGTKQGSWKLHL